MVAITASLNAISYGEKGKRSRVLTSDDTRIKSSHLDSDQVRSQMIWLNYPRDLTCSYVQPTNYY